MRHFIIGNTYPVKDQLKAMGCRFDGTTRAWYSEDPKIAEKAQAVIPEKTQRRGVCACECDWCRRCSCDYECQCKGGNRFDCGG